MSASHKRFVSAAIALASHVSIRGDQILARLRCVSEAIIAEVTR